MAAILVFPPGVYIQVENFQVASGIPVVSLILLNYTGSYSMPGYDPVYVLGWSTQLLWLHD